MSWYFRCIQMLQKCPIPTSIVCATAASGFVYSANTKMYQSAENVSKYFVNSISFQDSISYIFSKENRESVKWVAGCLGVVYLASKFLYWISSYYNYKITLKTAELYKKTANNIIVQYQKELDKQTKENVIRLEKQRDDIAKASKLLGINECSSLDEVQRFYKSELQQLVLKTVPTPSNPSSLSHRCASLNAVQDIIAEYYRLEKHNYFDPFRNITYKLGIPVYRSNVKGRKVQSSESNIFMNFINNVQAKNNAQSSTSLQKAYSWISKVVIGSTPGACTVSCALEELKEAILPDWKSDKTFLEQHLKMKFIAYIQAKNQNDKWVMLSDPGNEESYVFVKGSDLTKAVLDLNSNNDGQSDKCYLELYSFEEEKGFQITHWKACINSGYNELELSNTLRDSQIASVTIKGSDISAKIKFLTQDRNTRNFTKVTMTSLSDLNDIANGHQTSFLEPQEIKDLSWDVKSEDGKMKLKYNVGGVDFSLLYKNDKFVNDNTLTVLKNIKGTYNDNLVLVPSTDYNYSDREIAPTEEAIAYIENMYSKKYGYYNFAQDIDLRKNFVFLYNNVRDAFNYINNSVKDITPTFTNQPKSFTIYYKTDCKDVLPFFGFDTVDETFG